MKIDPITVEKERFIAQYMFVAEFSRYCGWGPVSEPQQLLAAHYGATVECFNNEHFRLLLKDVKNIADEEIMAICLMLSEKSESEIQAALDEIKELDWDYKAQVMDCFVDPVAEVSENFPKPLTVLAVYDYLRSRGYLVPWGGRSVEYILENNWARLI